MIQRHPHMALDRAGPEDQLQDSAVNDSVSRPPGRGGGTTGDNARRLREPIEGILRVRVRIRRAESRSHTRSHPLRAAAAVAQSPITPGKEIPACQTTPLTPDPAGECPRPPTGLHITTGSSPAPTSPRSDSNAARSTPSSARFPSSAFPATPGPSSASRTTSTSSSPGRDHRSRWPPGRIPACASNARGSCLGFWRQSARSARGAGCGVWGAIARRYDASVPRSFGFSGCAARACAASAA